MCAGIYPSKYSGLYERMFSVRSSTGAGKHLRIERGDGVRLAPNEVVEAVGGGCVDEAVAYPLGGLDAVAAIRPRSSKITGQNTYLSEISAMSSNASSTPSSPHRLRVRKAS